MTAVVEHHYAVPPSHPEVSDELASPANAKRELDLSDENGACKSSLAELLRGPQSTTLMISLTVGASLWLANSILATFLPQYTRDRGISSTVTGCIFAVGPVAAFIGAPLAGHLSSDRFCGRSVILHGGLGLFCVATVGFGLSPAICTAFGGGSTFLAALLITFRTLQGGAQGFAETTITALQCETFPDMARVFALQETLTGLVCLAGPPVGAALYVLGGFACPFVAVAVIPGVVLVLFIVLGLKKIGFTLAESQDIGQAESRGNGGPVLEQPLTQSDLTPRSPSDLNHEQGCDEAPDSQSFTWGDLMMPRFYVGALGTFACSTMFGVYDPTIAVHLEETLQVGTSEIGWILIAATAAYMISVLYVAPQLAECLGNLSVVCLGMICLSLGYVMLGLDLIVTLEKATLPMWMVQMGGLIIFGFGAALALAPCLPALLDGVDKSNSAACDAVSGIWNGMYSLGGGLGPMAGGFLVEQVEFSPMCMYVALFGVGYAAIACPYAELFSRLKEQPDVAAHS